MTKVFKILGLLILPLAVLGIAGLSSSNNQNISDENKAHLSWVVRALDAQRKIDLNSPMSKNNLLGTHNSFNSRAYATMFRYHDPQQNLSIKDQLNQGARFIELDVHWSLSVRQGQLSADFLLCHAPSREGVIDYHFGCSLWDQRLAFVLDEIEQWLSEDAHQREVIILYIEDHAGARHKMLYDLLQVKLPNKIFESGGCKEIPPSLSKQQVLNAGRQIVLWKDGDCAQDENLSKLVYGYLGELQREAEDRTVLGSVANILFDGEARRIDSEDVARFFKTGVNIVNLDNMKRGDERLASAVWSWEAFFPSGGGECVYQTKNGRWKNGDCNLQYFAACREFQTGQWQISKVPVVWKDAQESCKKISGGWVFDKPTNSMQNAQLGGLNSSGRELWLNHQWQTTGEGDFK